MSITYRMEIDSSDIGGLSDGDLSIMLEYLSNTLKTVKEEVFDMKIGDWRIYAEREGLNIWTIYRIEEDGVTTKV